MNNVNDKELFDKAYEIMSIGKTAYMTPYGITFPDAYELHLMIIDAMRWAQNRSKKED